MAIIKLSRLYNFASVDAGWRDIDIKFDGFLTGVGDLADTLLNKLGVGQLIVERQKVFS